MKKNQIIVIFLFTITFFGSACFANLSLKQTFDLSKKNYEPYKSAILSIEAAKMARQTLESGVKPKVDLAVIQTFQDPISGSTSSLSKSSQRTSYLGVTQPLFYGGKQTKALQIAHANETFAALEIKQKELNLYNSVSEAWLRLLAIRKELDTILVQQKTLKSIISDLKSRSQIGRNRVSDVFTAEAELARVNAEIESLKFNQIDAETQLKYFTSLEEIPTLNEPSLISSVEKVPTEWHKSKLETPEIKLLRSTLERYEFQEAYSKGDLWPQVDLNGNYYLERAGILEKSTWSLSVDATWTIFDWGKIDSSISEAHVYVEQAKLNLENSLRNQTLEIQKAIKNYEQKQTELRYYVHATTLSKKSYEMLNKDYNLGLISNIEVLRSLNDYHSIERKKNNLEIDLRRAWIQLNVLRGEII